MVEQDPVGAEQAMGLAVLDGHPMGEHLGDRVRAARVERGPFGLRALDDLHEHLAAASLVEPDWPVGVADRLQQPERAHPRGVGRELGHLEADADVALGAEVVDLVRLDPIEPGHER